jgi:FkbM family methyltransferase
LFVLLRSVPGEHLRRRIERNVLRPLLSRMEAELDVPVAGGFRVRVDTTQVIGRALLVTGMWEPHIAGLFQSFLEPGDVCVDAGANLGYFTLLGAMLVGPRGRVYALEPATRAFRALLSNLRLNGTANVTALPVAAGAASGEAFLEDDEQSIRTRVAVARESATQTETAVRVRSIASVVPDDVFPRVRLIKIDVEGSDADVLRGIEPIFESGARPAIIVEAHNGAIEGLVDVALTLCEKYGLVARQIQADPARAFSGSREELLSSLEHSYERHLLLTCDEDAARLSQWLRRARA